MGYLENYRLWCEDQYFDENTKEELKALQGNEQEIKERFYKNLEFGTGGLRGIIGAGTNRMNIYTVRRATQGLADIIKKYGKENKGVAIAFDSRHMSVEFSIEAALCLCANGIKAYRFDSLRPTPELSFALRELGCVAGIVITASHNPKIYNGYKVYWEDGAQITYPKDEEIISRVNSISDFNTVKTMKMEDAVAAGLYHELGADMDNRYIETIKKLVLHPEIIKEVGKTLKIVYTPLHGTGNVPVRRVLKELGYENVYVVKEQEKPDGDFSTVSYPNPEDKKAFALALELAKEKDADLVLATDPDADRLGIYAKNSKTGEYESFTGNMSGMLIGEYLLSEKQKMGILAKDGVLVKTIVSTNMADKVAKAHNLRLIEVLTGFKYIGEQIKLFEENHSGTYEFGFEESYGCLVGTHARDKDAVVAVMELCEAACYYATKGMTLVDAMNAMYEKYGYFKEGLKTMTFEGMEGAQKIKSMMEEIRKNPPVKLGSYDVVSFRDYEKDTVLDLKTKEVTPTGLPKSNVLYFDLTDDAWVCVRPSGTEPKIKFYIGVKGNSLDDANEKLIELTDDLMKLA